MNINFGKEISKKRKEKGLTQADVATQFGITVQAVSKWERGLSKPRGEIYYKLVDFLGLDVEMPPTEKKKPLFTRFISAFYFDVIKIICIGVTLASVASLILRFISSEVAITLIGAATSLFCFTTK